jgi:hypothetical protein
MALTLAQLIALGQVIYDETDPGANTHERVGDAILQIPTTLLEPMVLMAKADQVNAEILWSIPYAQFQLGLSPAARIRPGMIFRIYGWPYVADENTIPSNVNPTLLGSTSLVTSVEDMTLELAAAIETAFGSLEAADGMYFPYQPAFLNALGQEFRYKPQMIEIIEA